MHCELCDMGKQSEIASTISMADYYASYYSDYFSDYYAGPLDRTSAGQEGPPKTRIEEPELKESEKPGVSSIKREVGKSEVNSEGSMQRPFDSKTPAWSQAATNEDPKMQGQWSAPPKM